MKLTNGDEIEVGGQKYRVISDELFEINEGFPPAELTIVPREVPGPLDEGLIKFYLSKGYNVCPSCGLDSRSPASTGCPPNVHYGTHCLS